MSPRIKQTFKNRLWLARQRVQLDQKQVASLLNQQVTSQISQYEAGSRIPTFENALRLSIIYSVPVRLLFFGLYKSLQDELKKNLPEMNKSKVRDPEEFCLFDDLAEDSSLTEEDYEKVKKHSIEMVRKTSELHSKGNYQSI